MFCLFHIFKWNNKQNFIIQDIQFNKQNFIIQDVQFNKQNFIFNYNKQNFIWLYNLQGILCFQILSESLFLKTISFVMNCKAGEEQILQELISQRHGNFSLPYKGIFLYLMVRGCF